MRSAIPDNLRRLWASEDALIAWSETVLASTPYLLDHVDLIEAYMDCVQSTRQALPVGLRHVAIGSLYIRQFDSLSHGLRATLSGNFTGCAMYARDLVETEFLLDYLLDQPGRPEAWLSCDSAAERNNFSPRVVREALDKRDGFKERKRKLRFDLLSKMGSHPTPTALELKRDGMRMIQSGPFKNTRHLEACIQELARAVASGGGTLVSYCNAEVKNGKSRSSRLALTLQKTFANHFNGAKRTV